MDVSQMRGYIIAVVVMGFILLFGVSELFKIQDNFCEVEKTQFFTDLETEVSKWKSRSGSFDTINVNIPCDANRVLILDVNQDPLRYDEPGSDPAVLDPIDLGIPSVDLEWQSDLTQKKHPNCHKRYSFGSPTYEVNF